MKPNRDELAHLPLQRAASPILHRFVRGKLELDSRQCEVSRRSFLASIGGATVAVWLGEGEW